MSHVQRVVLGASVAVAVAVVPFAVAAGARAQAAASSLPAGARVVTSTVQTVQADGTATIVHSGAVLAPGTPVPRSASGFVHPDASTTSCDTDTGIVVQICTTINYLTYTGSGCPSGFRCGTLTSTNNTYYKEDPDTVVESGKWIEGVAGRCERGCSGYLSGTHDFGWHGASSGVTYTNTGYWNGKYTLLDDALGEQRGGTSTVAYLFRTKGYDFSLTTHVPQ